MGLPQEVPIQDCIAPRGNTDLYWASSGGPNMRKYWLVEVIENDCIVTRIGVYNEISPEPSGNPSVSGLGISLGLRRYFIIYPYSRHNTVTVFGYKAQLDVQRLGQHTM